MRMPGECDLATLLASLQPRLADGEYGFATLPSGTHLPDSVTPIGTFQEAEGLSIIAPAAELAGSGIAHIPGWAMITLEVHSSLAAVGMMSAIARTLADAGISVNAVAGYHHDHVFVQWDRRDEAVRLLQALAD
jgi:uncharacterized protein